MFEIPPSVLENLSPGPRACVFRLSEHEIITPDLSRYSKSRLAAVLVLLYEQAGELRVLLTTRSKTLRTHAGQTALPGGRADETDKDLIQTAYREAHEEVALPLHSPDIYTIGTFEPFLSLHGLVVTPVIAVLTDPSVIQALRASEGEVSHIFSHPLEAVLDPVLASREPLVPPGSEDWFYDSEYHSTTDSAVPILNNAVYRMHRFRSSASPVKGLTADILIKTAEIAFGRPTTYERYAPGQIYGFVKVREIVDNMEAQANGHAT